MLYKISVAVAVEGEGPSEKGLYRRFDPILIAPPPPSPTTATKEVPPDGLEQSDELPTNPKPEGRQGGQKEGS